MKRFTFPNPAGKVPLITKEYVYVGKALGSGSYGEVREGTWKDKPVAIKSMKLSKSAESTDSRVLKDKSAFKREAELVYSLKDSNIVQVFQFKVRQGVAEW